MDKSCRDTVNKILDSEEGWENYLDVYDCSVTDENFEAVQKDVSDSILGILANAAIAIAEQKKLLQSAKTPTALQSAVKLIAVTGGNLLHAGVGMLNWASNALTRRDSAPASTVNSNQPIVVDSAPRMDVEVLLNESAKNGKQCALLFDHAMGDYIVAADFNAANNSYKSALRGIRSEDSACRLFGDLVLRNSK